MFRIQNRKQRRTLYGILLLVALTGTCPPWNEVAPPRSSGRGGSTAQTEEPAGYAPLWSPPRAEQYRAYLTVAFDKLVLSWISVVAFGSIVLIAVARREQVVGHSSETTS